MSRPNTKGIERFRGTGYGGMSMRNPVQGSAIDRVLDFVRRRPGVTHGRPEVIVRDYCIYDGAELARAIQVIREAIKRKLLCVPRSGETLNSSLPLRLTAKGRKRAESREEATREHRVRTLNVLPSD